MYHILLVDDEPAAKMAFLSLLDQETTPYTVAGTAGNGNEALAFLQKNKVDILITDLKMPHMDGLELIHRLTAENFPGVILVMSNYSDFDLVREALLSGAQDYMLKVNMDQKSLLAQLKRATQKLEQRSRTFHDHQEAASDSHSLEKYRNAFFYTYLLGDPEPTAPAAEEKFLTAPPYVLFFITAEKISSGRPLPENSVKSILHSILGKSDVLKFPTDEYFCLSPFPENTVEESIQLRATQILRQLQMYLNRRCAVVFSKPIRTLEALKEEYDHCREMAPALFYSSFPVSLGAQSFPHSSFVEPMPPKDAAQYLTEHFFEGGIKELELDIDRFLEDCSSHFISPSEACNYAYHVVQVLILSNSIPAGVPVFSQHAALLNCASAAEFKSILLQLLPSLMENSLPSHYQRCHPDVKAVLLYLQYHYMLKLSLDEIASYVSLDKSYLCRLFKKETGQSIFQYLNEKRMKQAAAMLTEGDTYVNEVSAAVGIEDPFYFARLFKKYYGISPSEFKAKQID